MKQCPLCGVKVKGEGEGLLYCTVFEPVREEMAEVEVLWSFGACGGCMG